MATAAGNTTIARRDVLAARAFQIVYPAMQRALYRTPDVEFATRDIAKPTTLTVPTRHGDVPVLLFSPTEESIADQLAEGRRPPVHLITHGGAFIIQYPIEEGNVARYLASEVGCYVMVADYTAAPQAQFPVAEDQLLDVYRWITSQADQRWDHTRVTVGGPSAGGKYALSVATDVIEAIEAGDTSAPMPLAVTTEYGVADMSRPDEQRSSTKKRPVVGPSLMRLVRGTYFKGADLTDPRVSPLLHPLLDRMPPTLVLTAEYDTLKHESNDLAAKLSRLGVSVTHHEYVGVDHGFTHTKPADVARAAITAIGDHLAHAYRDALTTGPDTPSDDNPEEQP